MERIPSQPERTDKAADTAPEPESATPMGRFRLLARRLSRVDRDEFADAERHHKENVPKPQESE